MTTALANPILPNDVLKDEMTGKKFGSWLVLNRVENKSRHRRYLCRCDCGYEGIRPGSYLRTGATWCKDCRHKAHVGWSSRMKKRK
jgi:hypothetical protein